MSIMFNEICIYIYIYIYTVYLGSKSLSKHVRLKTTDCFLFKIFKTFESSCYFFYVSVKMMKKASYSSPSAFDHFTGHLQGLC